MASLTFALIPKGLSCVDDAFFEPILRGCQDRAAEEADRVVQCECVARPSSEVTQGMVIRNILAQSNNGTTTITYNGISVAVSDEEDVHEPIAEAMSMDLPVVTVDSDAPDSSRLAYIGTDNFAMGQEMARLLLQLRPQGGRYVLVSASSPNLQVREEGVRLALEETLWQEASTGVLYTSDPAEMAASIHQQPEIKAMLPTFLNPMGNATAWMEHLGSYRRNVTFVGTDWTDGQLQMIREGFVHGLVGQLPYEMGSQVASTLMQWHDQGGASVNAHGQVESIILGTNLLDMVRVPLELPPVDFDYNYLGNAVLLDTWRLDLLLCCQLERRRGPTGIAPNTWYGPRNRFFCI